MGTDSHTPELDEIFLEPRCCVCPQAGRQWCEDDVWPTGGADCDKPGVRYLLATPARAAAPEMIEALIALLRCPEIADCAPEDKDEETHAAERLARAAIAKASSTGGADGDR